MYALVVSKLLPDTGVELLDAIKRDRYYCKVVPVSLLMVTFLFVYFNWMTLKYFKHN